MTTPKGRKPGPKSKRKAMFGYRLTSEEKKALDEAADADGRSAADFARRALVRALKEHGYLK